MVWFKLVLGVKIWWKHAFVCCIISCLLLKQSWQWQAISILYKTYWLVRTDISPWSNPMVRFVRSGTDWIFIICVSHVVSVELENKLLIEDKPVLNSAVQFVFSPVNINKNNDKKKTIIYMGKKERKKVSIEHGLMPPLPAKVNRGTTPEQEKWWSSESDYSWSPTCAWGELQLWNGNQMQDYEHG